MALDVIITLISALAIGIGCVGIIYPILPGSILALGGIVLWAFTVRAPEGWWALGLGGVLLVLGMTAQLLLTGRTLKRKSVGLGIVVEFGCALAAGTVFALAVITYFVTA